MSEDSYEDPTEYGLSHDLEQGLLGIFDSALKRERSPEAQQR